MASPLINERDLDFVLFDILQVENLTRLKRFADHSAETLRAAIRTAHDLALEKFYPHNAKADRNEPTFDGEKVTMIPEVAEALAATPARFSWMEAMIFWARSGFSMRDWRAASRPWPMSSPAYWSQAPFLSTTPLLTPTSRMPPTRSMPWLK